MLLPFATTCQEAVVHLFSDDGWQGRLLLRSDNVQQED